jgi:exonuclease VII small subunit
MMNNHEIIAELEGLVSRIDSELEDAACDAYVYAEPYYVGMQSGLEQARQMLDETIKAINKSSESK